MKSCLQLDCELRFSQENLDDRKPCSVIPALKQQFSLSVIGESDDDDTVEF